MRALQSLPETAEELRALARSLCASDRDVYLGAAATETKVESVYLRPYRTITFATHGLMAGDFEGLAEPALVLTPPPKGNEQDDGLLTASEVSLLKLNADTVILSACNTAVPDGTPGTEGLSGLAKAFFYAGARSLLVSHWSVDSDAAVELTTRAYAAMEKAPGMGRAEALRVSMNAIMQRPRFAHPFFWAPFVVVGEGGAGPSALAKRTPASSSGNLVRDVQAALAAKGYDTGPTDGVMGRKTRRAIRAYQKAVGLPGSGLPAQDLLNRLRAQ